MSHTPERMKVLPRICKSVTGSRNNVQLISSMAIYATAVIGKALLSGMRVKTCNQRARLMPSLNRTTIAQGDCVARMSQLQLKGVCRISAASILMLAWNKADNTGKPIQRK